MKYTTVQVEDPEGLHVRNCARIMAAATRLDADLSLIYGEKNGACRPYPGAYGIRSAVRQCD